MHTFNCASTGQDAQTGPTYRPSLVFRQALFIAAALFCLTPWGSPPVALALGILLALTHENPFHQVGKHTAKWLLQACVVALGFGMNLVVVLEAGKNGLLFAAGSIVLTLGLGVVAGRLLQINPKTSALISSGTAICGGSAVAAVGSVIGAAEGEITVAMGTTFLLNAVALYLFPAIGHALHLSQTQFGTWAGVAIHDISSVVGAASHYGQIALETATAVKLSRALWIVPVAFGAALAFRAPRPRSVTGDTLGFDPRPASEKSKGKLHIPWFIGLFLLASVARSFVPGVAAVAPTVSHLATIGLTLTLFLIGAGISAKTLKTVGWKPLLQGMVLWLAISTGSLAVILIAVR
ncbi:MAG: putative sulfate exporter family transporter [Armatimonadota bacterium]